MSTGELGGIDWHELFDRKGTFLVLDRADLEAFPASAWAMIHRPRAHNFALGQERHVDWAFVVVWGATAMDGTAMRARYDGTLLRERMRYFPIADPATVAWLEMLGVHQVSWQTWNAACHKVTGVPLP